MALLGDPLGALARDGASAGRQGGGRLTLGVTATPGGWWRSATASSPSRITLLVLEIKPPADDRNLLHGLLALWPSYLAYALTFLFIGQVWANHHVMFDHIRAADRVVLLLNTLLLMVVAFLPFATSVLAGALRGGDGQRTAVVFYGIAFGVTALTFNAVWQYACRHRLLSEGLDSGGRDRHRQLAALRGSAPDPRRIVVDPVPGQGIHGRHAPRGRR